MAFPSLTVIAQRLSEAEISRLLVLKRAGPKLEKLEAERLKLTDQLAEIDSQIAALKGGEAPKKRDRPAKAAAAPAKRGRGRPPKAKPAAKVRRPRGRPAKAEPGREAMLARLAKARAARKTNKAKRTPEEQAVINARMAKARAARKAKV